MRKALQAFALVTGALAIAACSSKEEKKESTVPAAKIEVKVQKVTTEEIPQTETYTANVESDVKNNISPNTPYRIEKIYVDVGDRVSKGQTVVQLDASNLRQLQLLESTHQRVIAEHTESYSRVYQDYESEKSRLLEENEALQKRIDELQNNEAISKHIEVSESFRKEMIVNQILNLAEKRSGPLKENYWTELIMVFGKKFPALYKDLRQHCDTPQNIRVCILTVLDIGNDDQAIMLDTTKQRVSNIRRDLNKALFNEPSSRTLRKNLVVQYNIYGLERIPKPKKGQSEL